MSDDFDDHRPRLPALRLRFHPQERHADNGAQRAKCLACGRTFILQPKGARYDQKFKNQVVAASQDRMSLRGITRIFGVCRKTILRWVGEKAVQLPAFVDTLLPSQRGDVLELTLALGGPVPPHAPDRRLDAGRPEPARSHGSVGRAGSRLPPVRHTQRRVKSLCGGFFQTHASLLHQSGRRNLPRRTLVWHPAGQDQPLGAPGLLLLQRRREPPRCHPLLHRQLQPCHPAQSNSQVATTYFKIESLLIAMLLSFQKVLGVILANFLTMSVPL